MTAHPKSTILAVLLTLMVVFSSSATNDTKWKVAQKDYVWSFPADHWARHGYKTEWWYFTGHLQADDGQRFGYQFTFFRIGISPTKPTAASNWAARDLIMGHATIGDLAKQKHHFSEVFYRAVPLLGGFGAYPDPLIAWSQAPAGTDGKWRLSWNGEAFDFEMIDAAQGFSFSLSTRPLKPLIFQGPNGFSRKGTSATTETPAASHYYSFTRLHTTGRVSLAGKTWSVTGQSWMDKEFGSNQLAAHQVGWDWFSLQLNDGREIMLYLLRDKNGSVDFASATLVQPDGQTQYLGRQAFTIQVQERWRSPTTSSKYPSRWTVSIAQAALELEIVPAMANQENRSRILPNLYYWEGAVDVRRQGKSIGKGYVELTGYGTSSRPAI
ncbi:MAG: carotenoid 1,2-hydratase [bacterium]|nr:carotenoid 1,2-hydratase [bacterium]